MRILLLAPIHREKEFLKQKGKYPFLKGQGQQSWVEALEELGHKVFVFKYTDSILIPNFVRIYLQDFLEKLIPAWYGRLRRFIENYYFISFENIFKNWKLLTIAKNAKPNLIIISGGVTPIFPQTIKTIKNDFNCKVLLFSGVNPVTSSTLVERVIIREEIIDMVVENDRGYAGLWKKMGAKKVIVLPISSVDPKLHRKVQLTVQEQEEYGCDVCFVGSLTKRRQEILKSIRQGQDRRVGDDNYSLKIWGDILPIVGLQGELKPYYQGTAFGEKMVKIFNAAKIVLNFQPVDMIHGGNMRTFEIPGCGAFQLADRVYPDFLIIGKEVVLFKDIFDLKKKISCYLQDENKRLKIAKAGFDKVYKDHTYEKHLKKLLSQVK